MFTYKKTYVNKLKFPILITVLLSIPLNKLPWSLGNSEKNRYSQNGQKSIALDVHYLSMADFIVCTFSSNVCRLAYALRLLKIIHVTNKFLKIYFSPTVSPPATLSNTVFGKIICFVWAAQGSKDFFFFFYFSWAKQKFTSLKNC